MQHWLCICSPQNCADKFNFKILFKQGQRQTGAIEFTQKKTVLLIGKLKMHKVGYVFWNHREFFMLL